MTAPLVTVDCVFTDGFGYGDPNGISALARQAMPGNEDLAQKVDAAIRDADRLLVPVDTDPATGQPLDDDGCGDGRAVDTAPDAIYDNEHSFHRSLHRAKVMGGGATMASAARIGLGQAAAEELGATFLHASLSLQERHIGFGAHTDTNGNETKSGCGAIDRSVDILHAIARYETEISNTIDALGFNPAPLQDSDEHTGILSNFAADAEQESYNGRQVSDRLLSGEAHAVFKRLAGQHQETRIILNLVPGHTIDQAYIREATDGRAQAFAVDVWRLQRLADGLYDMAEDRQRAVLSMVAYTLGTAAVLTAGDLPVYVVSPAA